MAPVRSFVFHFHTHFIPFFSVVETRPLLPDSGVDTYQTALASILGLTLGSCESCEKENIGPSAIRPEDGDLREVFIF